MEKLYLETPSINRKEEAINYINEHVEFNSPINGVGGLDKCLKGKTYEEWLEETEKKKDRDYAYSIGRVPSQTFFLIRESDNRIVGMISVRYDLTPEMLRFGGNIGYGIRPTERRKGYNKINLYLGLMKADELGLEKVMLDCSVDNLGSDKTIRALGGVLERTEVDPSDDTLTNVYWIDVKKSLLINSEAYSDSISDKNSNKVNKVL